MSFFKICMKQVMLCTTMEAVMHKRITDKYFPVEGYIQFNPFLLNIVNQRYNTAGKTNGYIIIYMSLISQWYETSDNVAKLTYR